MNILISGATSMIGSKLCNLLSHDNKVFCLVRKQSRNVYRLENNSNIILVDCDAENFSNLYNFIDEKIDVAINFYWEGIRGNERNSEYLQEKSYKNSIAFLKSAIRLGAKNIVGVGSQAEYGYQDIYNEDKICKPISKYGLFKNLTREYYQALCKENNKLFKWARIFSAYGEFDFKGSLIMTAIDKFKNNSDLVLNCGNQIWNYTYDEDLVRAFVCLAYDNEKNGVYNVTRNDNKKLIDYLCVLRNILRSSSKITCSNTNTEKNINININTDSHLFENTFHFEFNYDFSNGILDMLHRLGARYE